MIAPKEYYSETRAPLNEQTRALARAAERMPALFNLTSDMLELFDLLEDRTESEEASGDLEQRLAVVAANLAQKAEAYVGLIQAKLHISEYRKAEADRLAARAKRDAADAQYLKDRLLRAMQALGLPRVETGRYSIRRQKNSRASVVVLEEMLVPREFIKTVIVESVDKERIYEQVKMTGEVPAGIEVVHGEHVRIS